MISWWRPISGVLYVPVEQNFLSTPRPDPREARERLVRWKMERRARFRAEMEAWLIEHDTVAKLRYGIRQMLDDLASMDASMDDD